LKTVSILGFLDLRHHFELNKTWHSAIGYFQLHHVPLSTMAATQADALPPRRLRRQAFSQPGFIAGQNVEQLLSSLIQGPCVLLIVV
jgi:hypothetical protein